MYFPGGRPAPVSRRQSGVKQSARRFRFPPACRSPSPARRARRKRAPWPSLSSPVPRPARACPVTQTDSASLSVRTLERTSTLPQLQRRQRKQGKNQRGDPKPHDHFRFAPAEQFEMVMNRRHAKNALPAQLERAHLQNHGKRFDDEDPANEKEQDFLLDDDRDGAQRSSQRQRANVAHKDFRGMRVVPEKAERSPHQRAAKYRELADARDVLNLEIGGPAVVAAHVGQNRKRPRRDDGTSDRQAIQPIRQVHRIGGTHDDDGRGHKKWHKRERPEVPGKMRMIEQRVNHKIGMESLQEWKHELRRVGAVSGHDKKHDADDQADESLEINLFLRRETQVALLRNFRVIIDEANDGKTEQRK